MSTATRKPTTFAQLAPTYAATYVSAEEHNEADNCNRIQHEVLVTYAMVSKAQWQRLVRAERRSRELDKEAAERLMASYKD